MSQDLSIELVRPGMRLAKDVKDAGGKLLASRGEPLGETLLVSLRLAGVRVLPVELAAVAPAPAGTQERLQYLFRRCAGEACSQALLRTMQEYREERPS